VGRHVDWYLVETERLLKGHVEGPRLAETLTEIEAHLADSVDELKPTCLHGEDPEKLAIERFGSPWAFAKATVGQASLQPYWKAARWPMLICFATTMLGPISIGFKTASWTLFSFCVLAFCVASWFAKRRQPAAVMLAVAAGVAVTVGIGTILVAPATPYDFATLRAEVPGRLERARQVVENRRADYEMVKRGIAYFSATNPDRSNREFGDGKSYLTPEQSYSGDPGRRMILLQGPNSWSSAKAAWLRDAPALLARVVDEQAGWKDQQTMLQTASKATRQDAFLAVGKAAGLAGAIYLGFMLVLNGICAAVGRLLVTARLWPKRFA
jgi:hypothetical protein